MSLKKVSLVCPKSSHKTPSEKPRLDVFLAQNLPRESGQDISKSKIRKLIIAGAVYINGKRIRIASKPVFPGAKVDIYIHTEKLFDDSYFKESEFQIHDDNIIFEDDDIIVVNKPSGLPTQPTLDKARNNLYASTLKFLNKKTPSAYLGLHHRIDKFTSGLVLFTKSKRANEPVSRMFKEHSLNKEYIAIVENPGVLSQDFLIIKNHLKKDPKSQSKMAKFMSTLSGGQYAESHITVLEKKGNRAIVKIKIVTGRTHQIRVHLSELGTPILGDPLYGGRQHNRMMLHAWKLKFPHPISRKTLQLEAPLPSEFRI